MDWTEIPDERIYHPVTFELTEEEWAEIDVAILGRTQTNIEIASDDKQVMSGARENPDQWGVPVEYVGRRWLPEAEWWPLDSRPDEGWDARLPTGRTLDMKGSQYPGAHLLVAAHQLPVTADLLVLGVVARPCVTLKGWLPRGVFEFYASKACFECGLRPASGVLVHQSWLYPMSDWS